MAASTNLLNTVLDSGIQGAHNQYTGLWVSLYSGSSPVTIGGISQQYVSGYSLSSSAVKPATHRVNFSPTGTNIGYDEVRIYNSGGTVQLHSVLTGPVQSILQGDTHQILIQFSGS